MIPREDGAYLRCCGGHGYWYDHPPLPRDMWLEPQKVGKWWLYQRPTWPRGKKPVLPDCDAE